MRVVNKSVPTPYVGGRLRRKRRGGKTVSAPSYLEKLATPENISNVITKGKDLYKKGKTVYDLFKQGKQKFQDWRAKRSAKAASYNDCMKQCKAKSQASSVSAATGIRQKPNSNSVSMMPDMNTLDIHRGMITNPAYPEDVKHGKMMKKSRHKVNTKSFGGALMRGPIA
jgi:hypothetical protein